LVAEDPLRPATRSVFKTIKKEFIMKMKYIKTILFALLLVFIPFSVICADKYTHAETGIIFPNEIAEHKLSGTHVYDEKELGESIDFSYEGATATVYI
jgi:hypothetical protein